MIGKLFKGILEKRSDPDVKNNTSQDLRAADTTTDESASNPLETYFFANPGRLINKWHHYFEIYHRHFHSLRGKSPVIMEIGVFHGGSAQMWHDYFGPGTTVIGVDIAERCRQFQDAHTFIEIGDQEDRDFLAKLRERYPRVDVLIDDGGHRMNQQIATFEELYPHLQPEGIYLCEDMHTSYLRDWGGGYRKEGTFVEYSKGLIDCLYGWYTQQPDFGVTPLTKSTFALHFYDSVLVIEKRPKSSPPTYSMTGEPSFND